MSLFKRVGIPEVIDLMERAEALLVEKKLEDAYRIIKTIEDHNDILKNTQLKLRLYRLRDKHSDVIIQEEYRLGHR